MENKKVIAVESTVNAPIEKVWDSFTNPEHVTQWNAASPDWHSPSAQNDLRKGGSFTYRMEAKDGSFGFDFGGIYDEVRTNEHISYTMADDRRVTVDFIPSESGVRVVEKFDAESTNSEEMQRAGWQAILDNFKRHTESI
jgi:uncharacterized protein YndB with AHSA1/START domain